MQSMRPSKVSASRTTALASRHAAASDSSHAADTRSSSAAAVTRCWPSRIAASNGARSVDPGGQREVVAERAVPQPPAGLVEQRPIVIDEGPIRRHRQAAGEIADVGARAARQVDGAHAVALAQTLPGEPGQRLGAGGGVGRLAQGEPVSAEALHGRRSTAPSRERPRPAARSGVLPPGPPRRGPGPRAAASSPMTRASAAVSASTSPGGTIAPESAPTSAAAAPVSEHTTGRPRATASATARP